LSNTHNLNPGLITPVFEAQEALIYSFDFIGRINPGDGDRWFNVDARNDSGAAHTTSILMNNTTFRTSSGTYYYGWNDTCIRVVTIVNNREGPISYARPDGLGTTNLGAMNASVWLYQYSFGQPVWEHFIPGYIYARTAGFPIGPAMDRVRFFMDSTAVYRSLDLDNIEVYGSIKPAPPAIRLNAAVVNGSIELRWAGKAGRSYQVQYRTSIDSGSWANLGMLITPTVDGDQLAPDSLSGDAARFYRVQDVTVD
jgi:hypothetical protein